MLLRTIDVCRMHSLQTIDGAVVGMLKSIHHPIILQALRKMPLAWWTINGGYINVLAPRPAWLALCSAECMQTGVRCLGRGGSASALVAHAYLPKARDYLLFRAVCSDTVCAWPLGAVHAQGLWLSPLCGCMTSVSNFV